MDAIDTFGRPPPPEPALAFLGEPGVCPATLPSATAAERLIDGDLGAIGPVILSTVGRGVLVAAGMFVGGVPARMIPRAAIAGACGIEVFVLGYIAYEKHRAKAA